MDITSERNSQIIKNILLYFSICFLIISILSAIIYNSMDDLFIGLYRIITSPAQLTRDYYELGGIESCFLNVSLCGFVSWLLTVIFKTKANALTVAGYYLVTGVAFFGVNILNMLPCMFGVLLYAKVTKKSYGEVVNICMFATSLSAFISEVLFRYPGTTAHVVTSPGLMSSGIVFAIILGIIFGLCFPPVLGHSPNYHKGYDLFNAGPAAGFLSCVLVGLLYKVTGIIEVTKPNNTLIGEMQYTLIVSITFFIMFFILLIVGIKLNNGIKGYKNLLNDSGHKVDFVEKYGIGVSVMNMGIYGIFIIIIYLLFHFLFGAKFTGPTVGAIVCANTFVLAGKHPRNVFPIVIGYLIAGILAEFFFPYFLGHGKFGIILSTQAIVVGFSFATGLAPITGHYGFIAGMIAGIIHYSIVTILPDIHYGFNLYNGGLVSGVVAFVLVPILETYFKKREN